LAARQGYYKFRDYKQGGMGVFVREMKVVFPTMEQVYV
jgi:raffinose synthase